MGNIKFEIFKTPTEIIPCAVDFSDLVPAGETVNTGLTTVTATDSAGNDATTAIVLQSAVSGFKLSAILQNGTAEEFYEILFALRTTNYRFETIVRLEVREKL